MRRGFVNRLYLLCIFLFIASRTLAVHPAREYDVNVDTMRLPHEKNIVTTPDNAHLQSWTFFPSKKINHHITLVLAYGEEGNMSWWISQAKTLSKAGYTVVLFDYRGYGASDNFTTDARMMYYNEFVTDLTAVVRFAKTKYTGNKTGIWSIDMGTIITTLAAKDAQPDFIVGDSYITDPVDLQNYRIQKKEIVLLPPVNTSYEKALMNIKVPMLFFTGDGDDVTPYESIVRLRKKKPGIVVFKYKAGHMEAFGLLSKFYPGSEYVGAINTFLKVK